jgi:hypothetical protein
MEMDGSLLRPETRSHDNGKKNVFEITDGGGQHDRGKP